VSATGESISFEQDIKPLFRERDRQSMSFTFDLWSYDDVARLSDAILGRLSDGSMPCDGAWDDDRIALFQSWIAAGKPA
jgi:hypothetical protein